MANTRVKIPRTVLIERIQEAIDKATKEHEEAVAQYEKEVAEFFSKFPDLLRKRADEIAALEGDAITEFVRGLRTLDKKVGVAVKVSAPHMKEMKFPAYEKGYRYTNYFEGYIASLEKSKRVLEAATEDLISVSANDEYANYL